MSQPEDLDLTIPDERDLEAPDADAADQRTPADPSWADAAVSQDLEAPEWDAAEQSRVVQLEDEYR
jgi:hypothetical protein